LETLKQPQSIKELEGSKNNKFTQEVFATSSRDKNERREETQNPRVTSTNLIPRALQSNDLGAIWGVREGVSFCLKLGQQ
jgi:hypothetical protein